MRDTIFLPPTNCPWRGNPLGHQSHQLSEYSATEYLLDSKCGERLEMIEVVLDSLLYGEEDTDSFWKYGRVGSLKVSKYSLQPIRIKESHCMFIQCLRLGSYRSLPMEDDANTCVENRTRHNSPTRWSQWLLFLKQLSQASLCGIGTWYQIWRKLGP